MTDARGSLELQVPKSESRRDLRKSSANWRFSRKVAPHRRS